MASVKHEVSGVHHLAVGTEVSAKYRGAFCEAQIKSVKKNVQYKVMSKKSGKCFQVIEDNIRGLLKLGSVVEVQFPDQVLWQECTIQNIKDRSSYTVVFDDGDERTLSRGSLCLKGDRHYAKSETLDNLPLTDPENFGTPVLAMKKNRRRRPVEDEYDDESEDQRTPDRESSKMKEKKQSESNEQESSSEEEEDDDEKRARWLEDPLMGRVVIVEPNDKRKHWFPGLVVNPLCYEGHQDLSNNHLVVRSFKTGKFLRVNRSSVKEMSPATIPQKVDNVWKGIVEDAQLWQSTRIASNRWRIDIKNILDDSDDENSSDEEGSKTRKKDEGRLDKTTEAEDDAKKKEEEKLNHDFLEVLYKFMEDRGTPINKTPVLGYKDLDLYFLYQLVQKKQGSFTIKTIKEWKQIYLDLGIPKPNPAAGYNVRTAYMKYLGAYEEYCASWKHIPLPKKATTVARTVGQLAGKEKKQKVTEKNTAKPSQESRKIKHKDKDSLKYKSLEAEGKTRGRSSPVTMADSPTPPQQRRLGQRRRMSESSSASDVTTTSSGKNEKKKKGNHLKKADDRLRNPGGPDSEPDDSLRSAKTEKKETSDKKQGPKASGESVVSKRIRRNSTSNLPARYFIGDKLKVKYGQGKTFYDAKVLQVKLPEGPGTVIEYFVHYAGWNARHDEWIKPGRIVGFAEERCTVPSSPVAGSAKSISRRPKTPVTARSSFTTKEEITPPLQIPIPLTSRFPLVTEDVPHIKDDLPSFSVKPRVSSILKKNLIGEFEKSSAGETSQAKEEIKRPQSPILTSSQRQKRPKSPPIAEVTPVSLEESTEVNKMPPTIENKPQEVKMETSPEAAVINLETESKKDDTSKEKGPESIAAVVALEDHGNVEAVESSKDNRERSVSPSEESISSSPSEVSEDNSNEARSGTPPIQRVRRTSRRSKSPAYLLDSIGYTAKRRKCNNTSAEKSPSPAPQSEKVEDVPKPCVIVADQTPATTERLPLPSLSVLSSNSSSSEEGNAVSKVVSPILSTCSLKLTNTKVIKPRKKTPLKVKENEEEDVSRKANETKLDKTEQIKVTEYDNFDEEAPSIALEKHHEHKPEVEDDVKISDLSAENSDSQTKENTSGVITDTKKESVKTDEPGTTVTSKTEDSAATSVNIEAPDSKTSKRKIKKRKASCKGNEENLQDIGESKTHEETEDSSAEVDVTAAELKHDSQDTDQPLDKDEKISASTDDVPASSSNHGNPQEHSLQHNLPLLPQNPPSSSKVLLENTPPTTPEQSPNYISEDQDIDASKTPPALDSDVMDIGEEHKDSGGNTSSSGCEHPAASEKTEGETQAQKNEKHEKEEDIPSPPPTKKKRRERQRKRTASKSRAGRRSIYANEQDSESEDDQDNEVGETNHRKRHDSRSKPRKRRAKARPEPPSAPPPLPREELESMSQDERIALLQTRMAEMRKVYHQLKQEVANIDRKRKRAKRREREAAEAAQSSSKRVVSPFTPPKGHSLTVKAESVAAPCASTVVASQAASEPSTPHDGSR